VIGEECISSGAEVPGSLDLKWRGHCVLLVRLHSCAAVAQQQLMAGGERGHQQAGTNTSVGVRGAGEGQEEQGRHVCVRSSFLR
jgi:hypothetical protein